ncbi:class I SAM-dependent methyltransferase [uncultured Cycloclasticus sp.]|uniref:class I SAM-dependent methyltransferase n=1 Tax=uncultured Cycloclasticus sp. TaxID=172194 RepID=UPI002583E4F7|nr:class I SAM-dependent methyltransferase [uncultured Cycloclasticus sp.]
MSKTKLNKPDADYEFSEKYDEQHARSYFEKHENGFWRRLSNKRDQQVSAKALKIANNPMSILDVPCGTGRFWELLADNSERKLYASDNSQDMINTGLKFRPPEVASRFIMFEASAFDLPFEDNFVDTVFCIRLIHHIGVHEDRVKLLSELARVANNTVIVSLWVDGNYKAWRRKRLETKRQRKGYQNRFVVPAKLFEEEVSEAGLEVKARLDFIKHFSMWRTYVLQKKV